MRNFSKRQTALESVEAYSELIRDDVYVVRSARGDEWRLIPREEMFGLSSCYIEHYRRYSPKERMMALITKFLQENNIMGGKMSVEGKALIVKMEDKTFKIEAHEN